MDSIVGFKSDGHDGDIFIENMDAKNRYSMIKSSSGMFLKTDYLYGYTCLMPDDVHAYIDKHPECRDIAMNMMVSGMTAASPVLVEANYLFEMNDMPKKTTTKEGCIKGLTTYFNEQNTLILNDEFIAHSKHDDIQSAVLSWSQWDESFGPI
jgi:hypothetical protein